VEFRAPRTVVPIEVDIRPPRDGEVLIRTLCSGISGGTETLAYRGEIDPNLPLDESIGGLAGTFSFPFRYGYSVAGTIEESRCELEVGASMFCFHPHQSLVVRPGHEMIPTGSLDPRLATMFPLVETALQISLDAGQVAHGSAVVLGLGPIGLLTGALLTNAGASVIGSDPIRERREAADFFGFEATDPPELGDRVAARTNKKGVPLVVDATGNPGALTDSLDLLAHEGTALVASWYGTKQSPLPLGGSFHRRRLTIRSTQVSTIPASMSREWTIERRRATALKLMSELPLKRLATHEFGVGDAAAAFEAVDRAADGLLHAALVYD
jgi:2-desacetyl-2-hydroxyethyl bacteriochlorophyllide A dehydrogenase